MANKFLVLLTEIFVLISSLIQFIITTVTNDLSPIWVIILIALVVLNVLLIASTIKKTHILLTRIISTKNKVRSESKIAEYMLNWIRGGQRIAILSRDLSWVKGEIEEELCNKAKNDELIVFLPKKEETGVSRKLMSKGAEVKYYLYGTDTLHHENKVIPSRFTIARYEATPRLTTPNITGDFHINEEYTTNESTTKISSDMIDIMRSMTHRTMPFDKDDEVGKIDYLTEWLSNGGRCFILTRDLSWANHQGVKDCLLCKAKLGEVTIFMQKKNQIADELIKNNADVRFYGPYNYTFKNRFIISHWGTSNAKITTRSIHDEAIVNHIYDSNNRIYSYAIELADFLDRAIPEKS